MTCATHAFLAAGRWLRYSPLLIGVAFATSGLRAEDWLELKTPHFTVFSEASESRTRDWAVEFELFRRGMSLVMPVEPAAVEPLTLVLFRSDRRLRPFKPVEAGKAAPLAGFFVRLPGRNVIALSIQGARDDVREVIFHEGVHWHLSAAVRERPLWMEEGLAEVFGNFRLSGNTFVVGSPRPAYSRYLRAFKTLPYAQLAGAGRLAYGGKHREHAEKFYYQSWAMVHALFFAEGGLGVPAMAKFLAEPTVEVDPIRDVETGLGIPAATMDDRLAKHLTHERTKVLTTSFDRAAVEKDFAWSPAPAGAVDLVLGNLLLGVERVAEAEPYLWRAVAALPNDPRASEALGILNYEQQDMAEAEAYFRDAIRKGTRSGAAYYVLAQCELRAQTLTLFGPPDPSEAVQHLLTCLELTPRFLPAVELIGQLCAVLPARSPEVETLIREAAARHRTNVRIQAALAMLEARFGDLAKARIALERASAAANASGQSDVIFLQEVARVIEQKTARTRLGP